MEKMIIRYPVLVEGRYDRCKLESILTANILQTDGFGIFRSDEKRELIRRVARSAGKLLVLTDADGAGLIIRNYINSILPQELVIHLYTPQIYGKERRKTVPSKEGLLGVEGMEAELLRQLFAPYASDTLPPASLSLTKADLFADRLAGTPDASYRRAAFLRAAGLPANLSANAMLRAVNLLYDEKSYGELLARIDGDTAATL